MTNQPDTPQEILATLKAKSIPNKYIRENNTEYWADIDTALQALLSIALEAVNDCVATYERHQLLDDEIREALVSAFKGKE